MSNVSVPVITIDGPTASGKGTVAQKVAQRLGFHYLDSGALYRLTALSALRRHTALDDEHALAKVAEHLNCHFDGAHIFLASEDVTEAIRAAEGAYLLETSEMTAEQAVEQVLAWYSAVKQA